MQEKQVDDNEVKIKDFHLLLFNINHYIGLIRLARFKVPVNMVDAFVGILGIVNYVSSPTNDEWM